MARSAEKAMTALARWRAVYVDKVGEKKQRPFLATECGNLKEALYFRRQIINEISRKVAQIQNPSLGEFKLRDLNDEINKLIREKGHWEVQIKELGGPDYKTHGPKMLDREGKEVPGSRGYRYFGAARDLPGVRELFEAEPQPPPRKTRGELMKLVDADYYGYRDEDDGVIVPQEQLLENEVIARKVAEWKSRQEAIARGETVEVAKSMLDEEEREIYNMGLNPADEELQKLYDELDHGDEDRLQDIDNSKIFDGLEEEADLQTSLFRKKAYVKHVNVPTQKQIEEAILNRKKMELLQKYMSDDFMTEVSDTRDMLGLQEGVSPDAADLGNDDSPEPMEAT